MDHNAPTAEIGGPKRRYQVRRRTLAAQFRAEFDRRMAAGEDIDALARAFNIEPWYARRRAKYVQERATRTSAEPTSAALPEAQQDMTPTEYACLILGSRVRALRSGYFVLDGRQVGPREVTRAANQVLRARQLAEIRYPGLVPLW